MQSNRCWMLLNVDNDHGREILDERDHEQAKKLRSSEWRANQFIISCRFAVVVLFTLSSTSL